MFPGATTTVNPQNQSDTTTKIIGNYSYNLRYCLGEGAYGKVYEGIDNKTQLKVAIKKLDIKSFERDQYLKNQIISEIEILKKFSHKNIVKFIDLITTQRSLYIITEFCQNGDLRQLMHSKRLNEEQSLQVLQNIVDGFRELVRNNVIHRDLKPANILIHDGTFKICDFGFAKFQDNSNTQMMRSCVGSPLYMAPQILSRKPYGIKCDIWSLGIIFHEMIFHEVPWKARDEKELLNNILNFPYKLKNNNLSKLSQDFLQKSLQKDEDKRIGWNDIFQMFESRGKQEVGILTQLIGNTKENNFQFYKNISGLNEKENKTSKIRKSIFDFQDSSNQVPIKDVPKIIPKISASEQLKMDAIKYFVQFNNQRSEIVFRHYSTVDLQINSNKNKQLLSTELLYENLILVISLAVCSASSSLIKEIVQFEENQKELVKQSKELQALINSIKQEDSFYTQFYHDFSDNLKSSGLLQILKSDNSINFCFGQIGDQEKEKMEDQIQQIGKECVKQLMMEIKRRSQENHRSSVVSADYICDVILMKKKIQKGEQVNYEILHTEKSEQTDYKNYIEKVNARQSLFSSSFSFF